MYHTGRYLTGALNSNRYSAPEITERNMAEGKIGLKTQQGFLNYKDLDIAAYRKNRLASFVDRLRAFDLTRPPAL